ncbi:MAG: hypothetical protein IJZ90_01480 [Clostridia bacterium]|nr:hypothetical protein [Clostridia bacterium]
MNERVFLRKCNAVIKGILITAGVIVCLIILVVGIHNIFFLTYNEAENLSGKYVCQMEEYVINVNFSETKYDKYSLYPLVNGTITFNDGRCYEAYVTVANGGGIYYYDENVIAYPSNDLKDDEYQKQLAEYNLWEDEHCIALVENHGGFITSTVNRVIGKGFYIKDDSTDKKFVFEAVS